MRSIQFPNVFVKLLFELKPIFTAPSFEYFQALVAGILLGRPKKTVTAATKIAQLERRFSNVNRFVSQYCWDLWQLGIGVLKRIITTLNLEHQTLTLALDATLLSKFGSKIFGCAYHFNYAKKPNHSTYIWGHEWLVIGLLHFSRLFNKWLCFPCLADLFVPEKYLPEGRQYKSAIDLAVHMVTRIRDDIPQKLVLVADGYFAKRTLLHACSEKGIVFVSRLQSNAALYLAPQPRGQRQRGRPRKYGTRLASLPTIAQEEKGFSDLTLTLYGKTRNLRVKRLDAIWKPAGQMIQILIVYYDNHKNPAFFFCTDLSFSGADLLTRVAARWSLETLFKDLKEHLGWSHWQCRVEKAVSRSATLTCAAASVLMLWSLKEASQTQPELWDTMPWYSTKATPSIRDMIQQLRCRSLDLTFLAITRHHQTMAEKDRVLRQLFRLAA